MTCPAAYLSKNKEGRRRVAYNGEAVPVCFVNDEISDLKDIPDPSENPEKSVLAVSELKNFEKRYGKTLLKFRLDLLSEEETCRQLNISRATLYRIIKTFTQHN
jgi:AraC-like DNA-binding protein